MGIQGLLPMLKEIQTPVHIREYAGMKLAIDGYVWLHRGAYGCAEELARGQITTKYVNYAMHRVRMLKHFGVEPLVVLDGGPLPSKEGTENEREKRRTEALAKGNAYLAEGKQSLAREAFVKAVDVTPEMAFQLIKALRQENIEYIVAPYEADPQLAYLERTGLVDGLITEDSDLLVFGARTVIFKLDGEGNGVRIKRDDFTRVREYNFTGWTDKEFRQMAILSGCDYLESVPGLGLKTAYRLMRKYKIAEKVIQFVRLEGLLKVPGTYPDDFKRAELTFLHQRVFDPVNRCLTHLEALPQGVDADKDLHFIGADLDVDLARGLASGDIDPITRQRIRDICPDASAALASTSNAHASSSTLVRKSGKRSTLKATHEKGQQSLKGFFAKIVVATSSSAATTTNSKVPVSDAASKSAASFSTPSISRVIAPNPLPAEPVQSRFFGAGKSGGSKGKDKARQTGPELDMTLLEEDDLIMLEMDRPASPESDADALEAMREMEVSARTKTTAVDSAAPQEGNLGRSGTHGRTPSTVSSIGGAISSPPRAMTMLPPAQSVTPPSHLPRPIRAPSVTPRRALSSSPRKRARVIDAVKQDDAAVRIKDEVESIAHATVATSDVGISSPPAMPLSKTSGFASAAIKCEADEDETLALSSPSAGSRATGAMVRIKAEPRRSQAQLPSDENHMEEVESDRLATILLSSDPIDMTSEPDHHRSTKSARRSNPDKVDVKPDVALTSSQQRRKAQKRPSRVLEEDPADIEERHIGAPSSGESERAQQVVASWKSKFMMKPAVNKGGKISTSMSLSSLATPLALKSKLDGVSGSDDKRPVSTSMSCPRPSKPSLPRTLTRRDASVVRTRMPLSPKSANESSAPRPMLCKRASAAVVPSDSGSSSPSDSSSTGSKSSSSPVIITHPKLLEFRYTGLIGERA